jgi:hypothetical protein
MNHIGGTHKACQLVQDVSIDLRAWALRHCDLVRVGNLPPNSLRVGGRHLGPGAGMGLV